MKDSDKTQLLLTDMSYMQHQIGRLRQGMKKNAAENYEFNNLMKAKP